MLLKTILGFRLVEAPLAFIFLIAASWTLYLVKNSPETQNQDSHPVTTTFRFILPILTIPYVCYEIFSAFTVLRGRDLNNKFTLRAKSRSFKISRVMFEFALGGLWFLSFIFSLGVGSWSMNGEDRVLNSSNTIGSNSTTTATTTTGNATVIPPANSQNTFIVPPGGKMPMVLGSVMWLGLIGLFTLSSIAVLIETARNWRPVKPTAVAYNQEMCHMNKNETV